MAAPDLDIPGTPRARSWSSSGFIAVIALLVIGGGWAILIREQQDSIQHARQLKIQELTGSIRHLDEVLTMSARMAAATGDSKWEHRYHSFEPLLDRAIKDLIALSPAAFETEVGRETDAANQKLVEMEVRSFGLVRAGDRDAAQAELFSTEYEAQKAVYARGMQEAEDALRRAIAGEDRAVRGRLNIVILVSTLAMLLIVYAWWRTARRRAEETARAARERIALTELATRAKSEFLANMSHEIRTPMTAIVGYAELLTDPHQPPAERSNCVQIIRRNGEHLLTIVNDILDLSKIEAGKMTVESVPCSPVQIVHDVLSLMRVRLAAGAVKLNFEHALPIPRVIQSDPVRLRQILLNLVGNSIKFTHEGSVTVVMKYDCNAPAGAMPRLTFEIRDTGIGMSPKQVDALFQPFTQADSSMSRRFGGTGLGLTISKRLTEMLGGAIEVLSTPGQGSTFSLSIPLRPVAEADLIRDKSEVSMVSSPLTLPAPSSGSPLKGRILLAEDGIDNQRLLCFHLRKAGAEVVVAENGRVAFDLALAASRTAPTHGFDLILMDMQMPDMDGYTATTLLRHHGYSGPIVALTAHAMQGDRERCLSAGCTDYLTKPIDRTQLIRLCAQYMPPIRQAA